MKVASIFFKKFGSTFATKSAAVAALVLICLPHAAQAVPSLESVLVQAAMAEIDDSNATGNQDTQCSDFVAKVLRRAGVKVPGFRSNEFHEIAAKYLPDWSPTDFTTANMNEGRAALRAYLNALPDHTALLAQWPRNGQSGHVAIVEKIADDSYMIYQAQAGLSLPGNKPVKIEGLLYGEVQGEQRSHLRVFNERAGVVKEAREMLGADEALSVNF